jgi:hypothetical protein
MEHVTPPDEPVIIETTGEEIPASARPRRSENPAVRASSEHRPDVIPFASTLRHLAPEAAFWPKAV